MPATARIELAQIGEQAMRRCIEVRCLFRDPLPQELDFSIHEKSIPHDSDIEMHVTWRNRGA